MPNVIKLKGIAKTFKIGRTTNKRSVNVIPPKRYVGKPPCTVTPGNICEIKNIAKELNRMFLKKFFIQILCYQKKNFYVNLIVAYIIS
jgi:hypothetical protein